MTARARTDAKRMRPEASELWVLQSDPTFAQQRLGWQATVSLETGIRRTAEWIRSRGRSSDRFYL